MRLVLLTFGPRLDVHAQACFCIISFLKADLRLAVSVVTDRPDLYAHMHPAVAPCPVDAATLSEWQQPHGFFWRVKIRALQVIAAAFPGEDLLYVDADTILVTGLKRLAHVLSEGHPVMHLPEAPLRSSSTNTERQNWQVLRGKTFGRITVDEETVMWNAGVIGVPAGRAASLLATTMSLCDAMCETAARRRLLEQLAFSLALAEGGDLVDARQDILHYWGNKGGWQAAIDAFWLRSRLEARSLEQDIVAFDPQAFTGLPVENRPTRFTRWLRALADKQRPGHLRHFGE